MSLPYKIHVHNESRICSEDIIAQLRAELAHMKAERDAMVNRIRALQEVGTTNEFGEIMPAGIYVITAEEAMDEILAAGEAAKERG